MGKGRRSVGDGELRAIRRLKLENQKLKKQISSLRKQLNRVDVDRYSYIHDMLDNQVDEDVQFERDRDLEDVKKKWECHTCARDYLRITIVRRADGEFYFRRCPTCLYKTRLKKFTNDIEGIDSDDRIYSKDQGLVDSEDS